MAYTATNTGGIKKPRRSCTKIPARKGISRRSKGAQLSIARTSFMNVKAPVQTQINGNYLSQATLFQNLTVVGKNTGFGNKPEVAAIQNYR